MVKFRLTFNIGSQIRLQKLNQLPKSDRTRGNEHYLIANSDFYTRLRIQSYIPQDFLLFVKGRVEFINYCYSIFVKKPIGLALY